MSFREERLRRGLTQAELAHQAGVSRQLVGAVEAGRHRPRVDAALALATALEVDVGRLFGTQPPAVDCVTGARPPDQALVRMGRVGDQLVTVPVGANGSGWDAADGLIVNDAVESFAQRRPGIVAAGCEPGLPVLESVLREGGMRALAVGASSATALDALAAGRVHAAVVHGAALKSHPPVDVVRFGLAEWRVGLAAPPDEPHGWWDEALHGDGAVIQREEGAGVQRAFEEARRGRPAPGPRVASHLEAASSSLISGLPAVTIEPAALAVGAGFHGLEMHTAELWAAAKWLDASPVQEGLHVVRSGRFQQRLAAVGGYDLSRCGDQVA